MRQPTLNNPSVPSPAGPIDSARLIAPDGLVDSGRDAAVPPDRSGAVAKVSSEVLGQYAGEGAAAVGEVGGAGGGAVRVLLVEDEDRVAAAQELALGRHGYQVVRVATAAQARHALNPADGGGFDVVVLDPGLPDGDGMDVCRDIHRTTGTPVLITSGRADVESRLHALYRGADDYLVKPYDLRELLARLYVLLRRHPRPVGSSACAPAPTSSHGAEQEPSTGHPTSPVGVGLVRVGRVDVDLAARSVHAGGVLVALTPREFDILALLAQAPGTVLSREQIMTGAWGLEHPSNDHVLDVLIAHIRRKTGTPTVITTVRTIGFRLGTGT